eukprot:580990-Amphidinium_carterae.1
MYQYPTDWPILVVSDRLADVGHKEVHYYDELRDVIGAQTWQIANHLCVVPPLRTLTTRTTLSSNNAVTHGCEHDGVAPIFILPY